MNRFCVWPATCWLILCSSLLTIIWLELSRDFPVVANSQDVPSVRSEPSALSGRSEFTSPPRDLIRIIVARSIFSPSRRPYVHSQVNEAPNELDISLLGVLTTESVRAALVRLGTGEELTRVRERDVISDWQVESISAKCLYLRREDKVQIVNLWPKRGNLRVSTPTGPEADAFEVEGPTLSSG